MAKSFGESFWSILVLVLFDSLMGESKNIRFYEVWIFGRVPEPHTQFCDTRTPKQNLENQLNVFRTCCFLYILKLKKPLFVNWGKTGGAKVQPTHLDLGNRVRAIAAPGKYSRDLTRLPPTHVNEDVARHTQSVPILKHIPHDIIVRQHWKPSFYLSACHATAGGGGGLGPMSCRGLLPPKQENHKKTQFRMVLIVLRAFLGRAVPEPLARRA